ncbi:MAG: AraC family transcriptional regulator [Pseudomonadales bacterium]|nr:AraC family transcriptional regulator [Pseudomonadales bacterium]
MKPTLSARTFKIHLRRHQVFNRDIDDTFIVNELGIDPADLEDDDNRIPLRCVYTLINYTANKENDLILGLRYAKGQYQGFLKSAESFNKVATSLPDFVEILSRYMCLSTEIGSLSWHLEENGNSFSVRFNLVDPEFTTYHQVDGALMMLRESITANFSIHPALVALGHACPQGMEDTYKDYFQADTLFDQPNHQLVYKDVSSLLPSADEFENTIEDFGPMELAKHKHQPTGFGDSVSFLVERLLIRGEPSRETIAKLLCLSVRTLQRRLSQENTTYQELLDQTRKRLAQQYLNNPNATHTDIALWLGYSEASQYYQAFKRWFGCSAKEFNNTRS